MISRRHLLIGVGITAAVAVVIGLFSYFFEKVEVEETSGYSREASHNPFLAAQRYLAAQDFTVESLRGFNKLPQMPAPEDTLIASYNHTFEQPERRARLLQWIREGGHLVLELKARATVNHAKLDTPLLDQFGVYPKRKTILFEELNPQIIKVQVYQGNDTLQVQFDPQYSLTLTRPDASIYTIKDSDGVHLAEYKLGNGWVTLMSDMDVWRNRHIGDNDQATFLSHILGFQHGEVWIITRIVVPSLFEIMWQTMPQAVVAAVILLLLSLWALYDRFGPLTDVERQQRRSLLEHLDAVAHFNWRYNRGEIVLKAIRKDLLYLLEKRCPHWNRKSRDQQIEWINERTNIPEATIRAALFEPCDQASRFTRITADLQTIRNQL